LFKILILILVLGLVLSPQLQNQLLKGSEGVGEQIAKMEESDVKIAMKHTKKMTLFSVKNNSELPLYSVLLKNADGKIKFVKAKAWDRDRVDERTVMVNTNDRPLRLGSSLIIMLLTDNLTSTLDWSLRDAAGNTLLSGTATARDLEPTSEGLSDESVNNVQNMKDAGTSVLSIGGIDLSMAAPILGSEDAAVTIIEFGDFQCPKCYQWFLNEKPTIKSNYIETGKAKLYFMDFTFLGPDSESAAQASYCADDQGKYWVYHETLYKNQKGVQDGWANVDSLKQFAASLGLDMNEFNSCLDSNKYARKVLHNRDVGSSHGVEGTPTFFIVDPDGNTVKIVGPQPAFVFVKVINEMLT
jgi:protein-disulfide isomerase